MFWFVYYIGWKVSKISNRTTSFLFCQLVKSLECGAVFFSCSISNALVGPRNGGYWLSMKNIPCLSQNSDAITLPVNCSVFGRARRGLPTSVQSDHCRFGSERVLVGPRFGHLVQTAPNSSQDHLYVYVLVSKRSAHFKNSFFIDKCSWKMQATRSYTICKLKILFYSSTLRFARTILCFWATEAFVAAVFKVRKVFCFIWLIPSFSSWQLPCCSIT